MGLSKRIYMEEVFRCEITKEHYDAFDESIQEKIQLKSIKLKGVDYSDNKKWVEVKKVISEAYKKKEEIESNIRIKKS